MPGGPSVPSMLSSVCSPCGQEQSGPSQPTSRGLHSDVTLPTGVTTDLATDPPGAPPRQSQPGTAGQQQQASSGGLARLIHSGAGDQRVTAGALWRQLLPRTTPEMDPQGSTLREAITMVIVSSAGCAKQILPGNRNGKAVLRCVRTADRTEKPTSVLHSHWAPSLEPSSLCTACG